MGGRPGAGRHPDQCVRTNNGRHAPGRHGSDHCRLIERTTAPASHQGQKNHCSNNWFKSRAHADCRDHGVGDRRASADLHRCGVDTTIAGVGVPASHVSAGDTTAIPCTRFKRSRAAPGAERGRGLRLELRVGGRATLDRTSCPSASPLNTLARVARSNPKTRCRGQQ